METSMGSCGMNCWTGDVCYILLEVQVLTEQCRQTYNRIRPHSSLGYQAPALETSRLEESVRVVIGLT